MPPQLSIFTGNHLETLARVLAQRLRHPDPMICPQPLQSDIIMVQSKGMQRWISMAIAKHNGICANMEFPFPNAFIEQTYARVIGPLPEHNPFNPDDLAFRIKALIMSMAGDDPFAMIRNYLSGADRELKAYQLAKRLADIYDQYLVFRPEMIKQWEKSGGLEVDSRHQWQAILWQQLTAETSSPHRADLKNVLVKRLLNTNEPIPSLPERISVFGISHLPPFHLNVMEVLAHRLPVDLYLLNPCREYWADIVSEQQMIRVRSRIEKPHANMTDLHYEGGNRLLASWGHQGRQFFGLTQQLDARILELFEEITGHTLLCRIQQDILDLVDRPTTCDSSDSGVKPDASLRIHVCHSPLREVEVLHDQLLDILDAHPDIFPGDILVMTPDIAKYAPYIHGVFGATVENGMANIAYTVADQNLAAGSRLVEGFLQLLQLRNSRFEATRILDILEYPSIRERFGLTAADLPQVEQWIRETGIRWGWDGADRKNHGLPRFRENTWRVGLDRLVMGYAMLADDDALCAGLLPHDGIVSGQGDVLGRLVHFAETLYHGLKSIPHGAPLSRWPDILERLMDDLLAGGDPFARDLQALREVIEKLNRIASNQVAEEDVSFEVMLAYLTDALNQTSHGTGFMAGSVTFCAMLPMRSIPANVICILGMQHDAFPQDLHEPDFNLIAADPQPGDRSKRNDDKYLFLEALLSARNTFYISYVGRDIQDNSMIPPSVLVSELMEYITEGMQIPEECLVTVHPLQGFAPAYFNGIDKAMYSYSSENLEACRRLTAKVIQKPFFDTPLPPPDPARDPLELSSLAAFFRHPVKYLLEQRLGIYLQDNLEIPQDRENFDPDALNRFVIGQTLFNLGFQKKTTAQNYAIVRASGRLPHGSVGEVVHSQVQDEVNHFMDALARHLPPQAPATVLLKIDRGSGHSRIDGRIDCLYPQARVVHRLARIRSKDVLDLFVNHLAMQVAQDDELPDVSIMIGKDAVLKMGPVPDAASILDRYIDLFSRGLQQPLPIFPLTSHAYAIERIEKNKPAGKAMTQAFKVWQGGFAGGGECQDPYIRLCEETAHPFHPAFESLAIQVYGPLIQCMDRQTP